MSSLKIKIRGFSVALAVLLLFTGAAEQKSVTQPAPLTQKVPTSSEKVLSSDRLSRSYVAPPAQNRFVVSDERDSALSEASIQMDLAVKNEVHRLRQIRAGQMPYMNEAIIRDQINIHKLESRRRFTQGGPKDLDELIERAISVHTPALASRERIVLAKRRILSAIRSLAPEASAEFNMKRGSLSADPYSSRNYKISLTQPIFRGGVLWNTLLHEKAGLESAQKEYVATIEDLVSDVATAYLEYSRADQVVKFQEETLKILKKYADISKEKYKEELISEIENLNVNSLLSLNQYDHETSKQELELAKLELQRYLDIDLETPIDTQSLYRLDQLILPEKTKGSDSDPAEKFFDAAANNPSTNLSELIDLAYQHRAQLQVESSKLDASRLQEKIRLGEFMPKLDLSIDFGKLGEAFKSVTDTPGMGEDFRFLLEMSWNIGGNKAVWSFENDEKAPSVSQFQGGSGSQTTRHSLQIGLLDGLSDWVSVKEAEVAKLEQVIQFEKAEKEIIHDVKQSFFDYQKAQIRVKSSIQRYNYRKRLSLYSKHRLEKNEIQISEYLQAEIDVMSEASTLHKALTDYYTAKAKLNHAIGIRNYFPLKEFHGRAAKS